MKIIIRILLILAGIIATVLACLYLYFRLLDRQEQSEGPPPYPIGLGSYETVGSTTIDPTTLLEDIHSGRQLALQAQADIPHNPPFLIQVGWSQNDYMEIAKAYQKAIWQDDPTLWHLYKLEFHTTCNNTNRKFGYADFLYYQEVTNGGEKLYSVREIEIDPQHGYLAWGGDTFYPPEMPDVWTAINLENIAKVPAEKALALADQQQGNEFRKKENDICNITVFMWPYQPKGNDWSVLYSGKTYAEIWIPTK